MTDREITHMVVQYLFGEIEINEAYRNLNKEELQFFQDQVKLHGINKKE